MGAMNLSFYLSLRTVPLGVAVTVEFVGPLLLALVQTRRWRRRRLGAARRVGRRPARRRHLAAACRCRGSRSRCSPGCSGPATSWPAPGSAGCCPGSTGSRSRWPSRRCSSCRTAPAARRRCSTRRSLLLGGLAIAVLSSVVPYGLEMLALRRMPTRVFGILMSLEPAAAALAGLVVLGQALGVREVTALLLVSVASVGVTLGRREGAPVPAAAGVSVSGRSGTGSAQRYRRASTTAGAAGREDAPTSTSGKPTSGAEGQRLAEHDDAEQQGHRRVDEGDDERALRTGLGDEREEGEQRDDGAGDGEQQDGRQDAGARHLQPGRADGQVDERGDGQRRGGDAGRRHARQPAVGDERGDRVADDDDADERHGPDGAALDVEPDQRSDPGEADREPEHAGAVEQAVGVAAGSGGEGRHQRHGGDEQPGQRARQVALGVGEQQPRHGQLERREGEQRLPRPQRRQQLPARGGVRDEHERGEPGPQQHQLRRRELLDRDLDEQVGHAPQHAHRREQHPAPPCHGRQPRTLLSPDSRADGYPWCTGASGTAPPSASGSSKLTSPTAAGSVSGSPEPSRAS